MHRKLIFDSRWIGDHGIGRFARELRTRFPSNTSDLYGQDPISLLGMAELEMTSIKNLTSKSKNLFFSPSFSPPLLWKGEFIFTIHDLIHIDIWEESSKFKTFYYEQIIRPSISRAKKVLTVSEFSRQRLLEWSGANPEQIVVVGNGVDKKFSPNGLKYQPDYPYILYIRNSKPHKNVLNLIKAFAQIEDSTIHLVLNGNVDNDLRHEALRLDILDRIHFVGRIPDVDLPDYYRGATVVTMPSLYEGFGLPALEGMASGVPVVVSNTTSLPEVVGDAAVLVDPHNPESIADGLNRAIYDSELRAQLMIAGPERAQLFSWDDVATRVFQAIDMEDE